MKEIDSNLEVIDEIHEESAEEKKKGKKTLKIVFLVLAILVVLIAGISMLLPHNVPFSKSTVFKEEEVKNKAKEVVALLDDKDYDSLQAMSTEQMKTVLNAETIEGAKKNIADDFGAQTSIGQIYAAEIDQLKNKNAVTQITVSYENATVTYTISFDANMQLSGLYMK